MSGIKDGTLHSLVLLKSSSDEAKDKYIDYIQANNNNCKILDTIKLINFLDFEFINIDRLKVKIEMMFRAHAYTALILTSKQAIEALKILDNIDFDESSTSSIDVYCVGDETKASFLSLIDTRFPYLRSLIGQVITPSQFNRKQNSLELAKIIVENHKQNTRFRAFTPCSSIRKPDLNEFLCNAHFETDELFVYKTRASKKGLVELKNFILHVCDVDDRLVNLLVALFSPSCVDAYFDLCSTDNQVLLAVVRLKLCFVTIGPSTTRRFVELSQTNENFKHFKYIELDEPTPIDLWKKVLFLHDNSI
jgi:uroporphyrinogen-III synthase